VTRETRHWLEYGVFAFVVVTALATATAAWYTRRQWETSTDNGRRQLRAYVFPDQANLVWEATAKPTTVEVTIKNSGQTPAYRVSTATMIGVREYPLHGAFSVPSVTSKPTVIPPGSSTTLSDTMVHPLTADQLRAIQKGTQAVYVFGEIAYADAFGECRITRYRLYYYGTGPENGNRVGLTYLDEGNAEAPCR
jgi:hypothetical protein